LISQLHPRWKYLLSLLAGAILVFGFAPFNQVWLVFLSFAWLQWQWRDATAKSATLHGWLFGLGMQAAGVSWIFVSLHYHGGTPVPFAILMILLLSMYLALYPALAGFLVARFCKQKAELKLLLLFPAAWAISEWLQGYVMTGFAWMQPAYTQIDLPLAGFAPVLGAHGVSMLVLLSAGALVLVFADQAWRQPQRWKTSAGLVLVIWLTGFGLKQIHWTSPVGEPLSVALVQGNIEQTVKWRREIHDSTLALYRDLSLQTKDADLIIWPETAVPDYQHRVPAYLQTLQEEMKQQGSALLLGIFIKNTETGRYFNTLLNINGQAYRKRHLVPLGEYIPLRFLASFFNRWVDIPMSDIESGVERQPLLVAAGQLLGVSICFEDAFSRDVRRDLPAASLLVNVSNDAWFENSQQPHQHHAIARMRALESGRYMLRATNTGISAVINDQGEAVAVAAQFKTTVLRASARPMSGATPYVRWGDGLVLIFSISALVWAARRSSTDSRI
jgi:apolipoprotein N-acyltransferase